MRTDLKNTPFQRFLTLLCNICRRCGLVCLLRFYNKNRHVWDRNLGNVPCFLPYKELLTVRMDADDITSPIAPLLPPCHVASVTP